MDGVQHAAVLILMKACSSSRSVQTSKLDVNDIGERNKTQMFDSFFSQKRLNQQKRQRERERKELEHLKRSHLVNMRVVQRNLVYVTGMGARFAKEEVNILQCLVATTHS